MFQLNTYIVILVVIFVIVGIIMAVSVMRLRSHGKDTTSSTAPIPEREQSNKQTRQDSAPDTSLNGSSLRNERERNRY